MAEIKKKKKGLLTIPPELQEYLKSFTGQRTKFQEYPQNEEWGELSPENVWAFWKENNPYGLYMLQLRDWLYYMRVNSLQYRDEKGNYVLMEAGDAKQILSEADTAIKLGYPVEALPYYEESLETTGTNFNREYRIFLNEQVEIMEEEAKGFEETKRKLYEKYQPYSKEARVGLEGDLGTTMAELQRQSVLGIPGMTPSASMSEGKRQQLLNYVETQERELIDAANRGEITQEEATTRMRELNQKAYGVGSQFEKWQHEETGYGTQFPGVRAAEMAQQAQAKGAKRTTDLQAQQMKQSQLLGMLYPEQLARYQAELRAGWGQAAAGEGTLEYVSPSAAALAATFHKAPENLEPGESYEPFATTGGKGGGTVGTYIPPNFYIQGFANWAQTNPEFQKARATKEVQMWTDFPSTYPAYQSYMQAFQPTGLEGAPALPLTFEKWGQEDVEGKLLSEVEEQRKRAASLAAKGRLAPLTVNR